VYNIFITSTATTDFNYHPTYNGSSHLNVQKKTNEKKHKKVFLLKKQINLGSVEDVVTARWLAG